MNDRAAGLDVTGARLRKWREDHGLKQTAAAALILSTQGAWTAWERGERAPDLHFAFALEKLTDGAVKAEDWAFPRSTSRIARGLGAEDADQTGPHQALDADASSKPAA